TLPTTFLQPSLIFLNAKSFFGFTKPECTRPSLVPPSTLVRVKGTIVSRRRAILRIAVIAALPRIRQTLVALSFKRLTANHAVPRASRCRLIREARAFDGLKSRRLHQQPAADEFAGRQDSPDGLRRMGKHLLDDD